MYVHQAKPANPARTSISSWLMGISESSFDYPPTNERRCAFQSRIKYTSKGEHFLCQPPRSQPLYAGSARRSGAHRTEERTGPHPEQGTAH
jgi:hypothetical protein